MICNDTVYDVINIINKVGLRKVVNKRKEGKYQNINRDISILRNLGQGYKTTTFQDNEFSKYYLVGTIQLIL